MQSGALRSAQGRETTDPSPVCSDYLKSTKAIPSLITQFCSIGHFTTSTSNIGTSCTLIFHISLVSEPHLDVYIQLKYLEGSWDCCFAACGFMMVCVCVLKKLSGTIRLSIYLKSTPARCRIYILTPSADKL